MSPTGLSPLRCTVVWPAVLALLSVSGADQSARADPPDLPAPPELAIEFQSKADSQDVQFLICNQFSQDGNTWTLTDAACLSKGVSAVATDLGGGFWELQLSRDAQTSYFVKNVLFPWMSEGAETWLDDPLDDVVYAPILSGVAVQALVVDPAQQPYSDELEKNAIPGWWPNVKDSFNPHNSYPGYFFAPLIVTADDTNAKITAATNWPPRHVMPKFSQGRTAMLYTNHEKNAFGLIPEGESRTFGALVAYTPGDAAAGNAPWQNALDLYRGWLEPRLLDAGLVDANFRPRYSEWMKQVHGWLQVGLPDNKPEGYDDLEDGPYGPYPDYLTYQWDQARQIFPWVQVWGQMSTSHCCTAKRSMDPQYTDFFLGAGGLVEQIVGAGGHLGYYSRAMLKPNSIFPAPLHDTVTEYPPPGELSGAPKETALKFLEKWIKEKNQGEYGADVAYIDVLGASYHGDPLFVAELFAQGPTAENPFAGTLRQDTFNVVTEWPVDMYPTAFVLSGGLLGNSTYPGKPGVASHPWGKNKPRSPKIFGQTILTTDLSAAYYTSLPAPLTDFPDFDAIEPDFVNNESMIGGKLCAGEEGLWHWCNTNGEPVSSSPDLPPDNFAVRYEGLLRVPASGSYTFSLESSAKSRLLIDGVQKLAFPSGGYVCGNGEQQKTCADLTLSEGFHEFEVQYFIGDDPEHEALLQVRWKSAGAGIPDSTISGPYLLHEELVESCTFPEFGRYLLNKHITFLGYFNTDHELWGYGYDRCYYTERMAFLLGTKITAKFIDDLRKKGHPDIPPDQSEMNPILRLIVGERNRHDYWEREPVFLDRRGLTAIPDDFDVTRFQTAAGEDLLAVVNWMEHETLTLQVDGESVEIDILDDMKTGKPRRIFLYDPSGTPGPDVVLTSPEPNTFISGPMTFQVLAAHETGISNVDLYLDDDWIGQAALVSGDATAGTYELTLDTNLHPDGWFDATAIASAADGTSSESYNVHFMITNSPNQPPIANAGEDQSVEENVILVHLNGTASYDPDQHVPLTYLWTQLQGKPVTLSNPQSPKPTFTQSGADGPTEEYVFALEVTDALGLSEAPGVSVDQVVVTVNKIYSPVADAGQDATYFLPEGNDVISVTLDGSGSYDPQPGGGITYYEWFGFPDNPVFFNPPSVMQPVVELTAGVYVFALRVYGFAGSSEFDVVEITVLECGAPAAGDCCAANETPGCSNADCCTTVCDEDAFCCDTKWDALCVQAAKSECAVCEETPPPIPPEEVCGGASAGNCCFSNASPRCNDAVCCNKVCAADSFCCDTIWDTLCAAAAKSLCTICGEGEPTEPPLPPTTPPPPTTPIDPGSGGEEEVTTICDACGTCAPLPALAIFAGIIGYGRRSRRNQKWARTQHRRK